MHSYYILKIYVTIICLNTFVNYCLYSLKDMHYMSDKKLKASQRIESVRNQQHVLEHFGSWNLYYTLVAVW